MTRGASFVSSQAATLHRDSERRRREGLRHPRLPPQLPPPQRHHQESPGVGARGRGAAGQDPRLCVFVF